MFKKAFLLLLFFTFLSLTKSSAQHLFEEKFKGCVLDKFTLEKDSIMAEQTNKNLLTVLLSGLPEKDRPLVRGILTLQIMVEEQGSSCLVSLRNETNYKTNKWHLPEYISQSLTWQNVKKKVSVVLAVKFTEKGAQFLRYGISGSDMKWKPIKTW